MLLELVLTTSFHLFDLLFSEWGDYDVELGIYPSIVLCLGGLYKDFKLKVEAGMSLICQHYKDVPSSNAVAFIGSKVEDLQVDLSAAENIVNVEVTEN